MPLATVICLLLWIVWKLSSYIMQISHHWGADRTEWMRASVILQNDEWSLWITNHASPSRAKICIKLSTNLWDIDGCSMRLLCIQSEWIDLSGSGANKCKFTISTDSIVGTIKMCRIQRVNFTRSWMLQICCTVVLEHIVAHRVFSLIPFGTTSYDATDSM